MDQRGNYLLDCLTSKAVGTTRGCWALCTSCTRPSLWPVLYFAFLHCCHIPNTKKKDKREKENKPQMKATLCKFCPFELPLKCLHRCLFVALLIVSTTIDLQQHSHAVPAAAEHEGNTNSAASTNIEALREEGSSFNWSCLQERTSISMVCLPAGSKHCLFPMGSSQVLRIILKMIYTCLGTRQVISNNSDTTYQ